MKIPVSLIVDDPAPIISVYYEHVSRRTTSDGRPIIPTFPNDFLDQFCDIVEKHGIKDEMCFTSWEPLLALGKIADAALICTMDRDHFAPAMEAMGEVTGATVREDITARIFERFCVGK